MAAPVWNVEQLDQLATGARAQLTFVDADRALTAAHFLQRQVPGDVVAVHRCAHLRHPRAQVLELDDRDVSVGDPCILVWAADGFRNQRLLYVSRVEVDQTFAVHAPDLAADVARGLSGAAVVRPGTTRAGALMGIVVGAQRDSKHPQLWVTPVKAWDQVPTSVLH